MLYSIIRSEQDTRTFLYPMSSNWFNSSSQSLTAEVIQLSGDQQVSGSPVTFSAGWGGFIRRSQFSCSVGFVFPESRHISCFSMFNMLEVFLLGIFQTFCFPLHLWCFLVQSWTARDRFVLTLCEICAGCLNQRALFLQVLLSGETQEEWMRWAANQSEAI